MIDHIHWLGHASFRIEGPPLIYINPWRVARSAFHADVILLSSDQYDHCSPADVQKLRGPETVIIASEHAAQVVGDDVMVLRPWQSFNVGMARITAVPAYTYTDHHPVSKGEIGFVISIGYHDIYYAGATDFVPELARIQADVAILPLAAGEGTMSAERLVELARSVKASAVVPSHWGTLGGTHYEVQALARTLDGELDVVQFEKMR
jgi:L-ascorbate metabolism protein UlaG (beta-lactamase superfamily)